MQLKGSSKNAGSAYHQSNQRLLLFAGYPWWGAQRERSNKEFTSYMKDWKSANSWQLAYTVSASWVTGAVRVSPLPLRSVIVWKEGAGAKLISTLTSVDIKTHGHLWHNVNTVDSVGSCECFWTSRTKHYCISPWGNMNVPNESPRCQLKLQIHFSASRKVRGLPKWAGLILWTPWTSFTKFHGNPIYG